MMLMLIYVAVGTGKFIGRIRSPSPLGVDAHPLHCRRYLCDPRWFLRRDLDRPLPDAAHHGRCRHHDHRRLSCRRGCPVLAARSPGWDSLAITWNLWPDYVATVPAQFHQYAPLGPYLGASLLWLVYKLLLGPFGWDFAFFLTTKSPREASLSAGMWTLGHTVRWLVAGSFLTFGVYYLGTGASFDAEKIMPLVVKSMPAGIAGLVMAVLLAALMSTLSAIINVSSNVVLNDFLKRFIARKMSETSLVHLGMIVSSLVIIVGFAMSFMYDSIIAAWEMLLYVMLTVVLVPGTFRWHWWRFGARSFIWSMLGSAIVVGVHKLFLDFLPLHEAILFLMTASTVVTVVITFLTPATDMESLLALRTGPPVRVLETGP